MTKSNQPFSSLVCQLIFEIFPLNSNSCVRLFKQSKDACIYRKGVLLRSAQNYTLHKQRKTPNKIAAISRNDGFRISSKYVDEAKYRQSTKRDLVFLCEYGRQ